MFDDRLHANVKVRAMSDRAFRLWVCAITCSNGQKTGGFLSKTDVQIVAKMQGLPAKSVAKTIQELIDNRFFYAENDGFRIHDWEKYNGARPPKSSSTERVQRWREKQKRHECNALQEPLHETRYSNADVTSQGRARVPSPPNCLYPELQAGSPWDFLENVTGEDAARQNFNPHATSGRLTVPEDLVADE